MVAYSLALPETYLLLGKRLHPFDGISNHVTDTFWFDKNSNKRH